MRCTLLALGVWLLLCLPLPLSAQPHPCAVPDSGLGQTSASQIRIGLCHGGLDTDGRPVTLAGFGVTIGDTYYDLGLPTPSEPDANGLRYYESAVVIPVALGTHVLRFAARDSTGRTGPATGAFTLEVTVGPPGAPLKIRVIEVSRPPGDAD